MKQLAFAASDFLGCQPRSKRIRQRNAMPPSSASKVMVAPACGSNICAAPSLEGIYVGPFDLAIAVGGAFLGDPAIET